ncbi:MAG: SDR family oxidoreductase [Rhodothermales bacterium]|nr:SDR family oxidoreductase [Rhodothermales bacterium]
MQVQEYLRPGLFEDKTVFVTGGGSGINLGIARSFAALGASVGICGRTLEKLEAAKAELEKLGAEVSISVADVRDFDATAAALQETHDALGAIDCLVCGAAGNFLSPAEALSPNGFKSVVDIDLLGSFNAARAAFEQLRETRGNIIFVSAGQAFTPYFGQVHAGAAKAGVDNLMRNLALEWGRFGIRSNSIAPGPIEGTEGFRRLATAAVLEPLKASIPVGRFGTVDDIGNAAAFLASPLASFITGTLLIVDGGQNLPGSGIYSQTIMKAMSGK